MTADSFNDVLFWIGNAGVTGLVATLAFLVLISACLSAGFIGLIISPDPAILRGHRIMYGVIVAPLAACAGLIGFALVRDFAFALTA
jgi:hypothetical protein